MWGFVAVLVLFLVAPILVFLVSGWLARKREIVNSISKTGAKIYLDQFFGNDSGEERDLPAFEKCYTRRFGRRMYIVPLVLLTLSASLLLILAVSEVLRLLDATSDSILRLPVVSIAALAGGYMWAVNDVIGRARRFDLAPVHINWMTFRLIISIPMGTAVAEVFSDEMGAPLAFFLGAFPTSTLFTIIRRLFKQQSKIDVSASRKGDLEMLQGIDSQVSERFVDEGISSVVQLAYCDPIDLTMRSNYSFSFVADCVSQALAWLYFEESLPKMRVYSIRGAQEVWNFVNGIDGEQAPSGASETLTLLARSLEIEENALLLTLREISEDPYTNFLVEVWQTS